MRRKALVVVALLLVAGCSPFENKMTTACEKAIKDVLKAPSGYKRISLRRSDVVLKRHEYAEHLRDRDTGKEKLAYNLKAFDDGLHKPAILRLFVEYDAPNSFNAPIRSTDLCEYVSTSGDESLVDPVFVKINGRDYVARVTGRDR